MNEHIPNTHNSENEDDISVADRLLKSIENANTLEETEDRYLKVVEAFQGGEITPQENNEMREMLEYKISLQKQALKESNEAINRLVKTEAPEISTSGLRRFLSRRKK